MAFENETKRTSEPTAEKAQVLLYWVLYGMPKHLQFTMISLLNAQISLTCDFVAS